MEYELCKIMPGNSLASLDETDIETLFDFVLFISDKAEKEKDKAKEEQAQYVTIGGKTYKKVAAFSTPI